ncbi:MAG TPA: error-prone DNA polymerase [Tepidisphaeraceae bacterium]|jgi:error-prone DNA polymerase
MPDAPSGKLYPGAADKPGQVTPCPLGYAELDVTTNYSFLRGASHPDELVYQAARLGYRAMAVTDVNTLAGIARAYEAAKTVKGFRLIVGARLVFADGTPDLLVWPRDAPAYAGLCRLITLGRRRAPKGECRLTLDDFFAHHSGLFAAVVPGGPPSPYVIRSLRNVVGDRLSLAVSLGFDGDDEGRLRMAVGLSQETRVPLVATNGVHYHHPCRRPLHDVLTCTRHGCTIHAAGSRLLANAERHLKSPAQMRGLFAACPSAIDRGLGIVRQITFDLNQVRYDYPLEAVPPGVSPSRYLRRLTMSGARSRYPAGVPREVTKLLRKELKYICHSKYESYFITVYDLVRYARSRQILCQGRGSAANSAVCYCLGVTSVDPANFQLVFERFASQSRGEPPDIDIDFEHERREEVIQYVYEKYGRDHAAMTATLITYRGRSAIRDVGKALGFSQDRLDHLTEKLDWWHSGVLSPSHLREADIDPSDATVGALLALSTQLLGFPRHLSQHVGGMVISRTPLSEIVPIQNAAMDGRTVIEWDKDDLDTLGLFKVDLLALGMLTAISRGLEFIAGYDTRYALHTIPHEDRKTYDMISDADTVGVFQIESRAQMSMLPRLRPREFYDLVIEVAIVRPGPIQGEMVHPFLQRREAQRNDPDFRIDYPKPELAEVLQRTLGVPLFQEQAMRIAMVAAGFTGAEADALRKSMAAWRRSDGIHQFRDKFVTGMIRNGYEADFAQRCFKQVSGFGEYGFPESHAASFARLVYVSAWMKRHHPAAFAAALLNSQPMGFYAPAQIVRDAIEHGVRVLPTDVNASAWDCTLELPPGLAAVSGSSRNGPKKDWGASGPAIRLGLRQIKGLGQSQARLLIQARASQGPFTSVEQLQQRTLLDPATVRRLAGADAFSSISLKRRQATWDALALFNQPTELIDAVDKAGERTPTETPVCLPDMPAVQEVFTDYATSGLSLKQHPVFFARAALTANRVVPAGELMDEKRFPHGRLVRVAGLVLLRQRPGTASGVVFMTLEDETGIANLVLWSDVYERNRRAARHATLLQVHGTVQRQDRVVHVLVQHLYDQTHLIDGLHQPARNFH